MSDQTDPIESLSVYIPMDRRLALAHGESLPFHTTGAALFADISGFTALTEALAQELGARRGAEELTRHLNQVYDALIIELHRYRGSVIGFSGDAITCWLDGDDGRRAAACALSMQAAMDQFAVVKTGMGRDISLSMKTAVAVGPVRRFLVGDKKLLVVDAMAGPLWTGSLLESIWPERKRSSSIRRRRLPWLTGWKSRNGGWTRRPVTVMPCSLV